MTTTAPAPLSVWNTAQEAATVAARSMLPLVAATLRAQYPTGAYLVLRRGDEGDLVYHSIRADDGSTVVEFPETWWRMAFPRRAPREIAALWGDQNPEDPAVILSLLQAIDAYGVVPFLPDVIARPGEDNLEATPVGVPLGSCPCGSCARWCAAPRAGCAAHPQGCEPDDHVDPHAHQ